MPLDGVAFSFKKNVSVWMVTQELGFAIFLMAMKGTKVFCCFSLHSKLEETVNCSLYLFLAKTGLLII